MLYQENMIVPVGFETGRGYLSPMSSYQPHANPRAIVTPGAFGLPGSPSPYSAFKVFEAMGDQSRKVHKANINGFGGWSFNQLFNVAAYGGIFNREQV